MSNFLRPNFLHDQLFTVHGTVAHQALLSMGFSRKEYQSDLPFSPPGHLPNPGIDPGLLYCRQILHSLSHHGSTHIAPAAAAKSLQSCPTLWDPIDGSPPGSSVPGILQARTLEWVASSFSNACMHAKALQSCPTLCNPTGSSTPGSSKQEHWSGLPFPSPHIALGWLK